MKKILLSVSIALLLAPAGASAVNADLAKAIRKVDIAKTCGCAPRAGSFADSNKFAVAQVIYLDGQELSWHSMTSNPEISCKNGSSKEINRHKRRKIAGHICTCNATASRC